MCIRDSGLSGLANSSQSNFVLSTNVPANTQTSNANIAAVQVFDVAGNETTVGPYGPYEVDKLAPSISNPQLTTSTPTLGQTDTASYTCSDSGGSGVVSCGPAGSGTFPAVQSANENSTLNTGTLGNHTFTVNSQDAVGNVSTPVNVPYVVGQATDVYKRQLRCSPSFFLLRAVRRARINGAVVQYQRRRFLQRECLRQHDFSAADLPSVDQWLA